MTKNQAAGFQKLWEKADPSHIISLLSRFGDGEAELEQLCSDATRYAETLDIMCDYLSRRTPKKVLDLGTGNGWMAILLKICLPRHRVIASDVEIGEKVRMRLEALGIEIADNGSFKQGRGLPFDNDSFDVCLFLEVFEHIIEDPRYVLGELFRLLRRDGLLFFTTPNLAHVYNRVRLVMGRQPQFYLTGVGHGSGRPRGHFREWTMEELLELFGDSGFRVVDKRYVGGVGSAGMVSRRLLLRLLYYPYKALVAIRPTFRSQIAIVARKE